MAMLSKKEHLILLIMKRNRDKKDYIKRDM